MVRLQARNSMRPPYPQRDSGTPKPLSTSHMQLYVRCNPLAMLIHALQIVDELLGEIRGRAAS